MTKKHFLSLSSIFLFWMVTYLWPRQMAFAFLTVSQMTTDMFHLSQSFPVLSSFMTCHRVCNQINTTGATSGAGTAYPSGAPEFTTGFHWVPVTRSLVLCMFCRSLFVLLYFFFWQLCCLFFFDIRILITLLVSSNSSVRSSCTYLELCFLLQ